MPSREIETAKITGRPGVKFLAEEFAEKRIRMKGVVKGDSASDLQTRVDNLHKNVVRVEQQALKIETGREYTASVASAIIGDPRYSQTIVPFDIEFVCADPFALGPTETVVTAVPSGTTVLNLTVNISGTMFAEPTFTYNPNGSVGSTTTSGMRIDHIDSGLFTSWSGSVTTPTLDYGAGIAFNYKKQEVTISGTLNDFTGNFLDRWEPGDNTMSVTFNGNAQGGNLTMVYTPRYL